MSTPTVHPVRVVDRVVLPVHRVDTWLESWRTDYVPGATARGLRDPHVWRSHHDPDSVELHITWELAGIYEFYGMRGAAAADPAVARFWADTDAIALHRQRDVLALEEDR
ncbi:hypothetical protein JK358_29290 [Nocardia sp. 2]|uniref:Uncharacterized protein n=1 Tax=Nocardia acididurans TaxID=2802282 RepID=A0ABS1MCY6_9NOCA|nr:hypothetical protein [Nocardia acididurans]MBL1078507.1 hypothetical protein [Nocardia acididurans]